MLNRRCLDIINHLIENNNLVNIKELAESYKISERSIRYDIENINYFFVKNDLNSLVKESKGIYKIDEKKERLNNILELLNVQFYTFSKTERQEYLKAICLFSESVIRLHEISETLSVSISTIKVDLKEVKMFLNEKGLNLKFLPKLGLVLDGSEEKIRKLQLKFLLEYINISNDELLIKSLENETLGYKIIVKELIAYFDEIALRDVRIFIKRIEKQLKTLISDEAYEVLEFYLLIAIKRLQKACLINKRAENENFLKNTHEYKILMLELNNFENNFNIKFNDSETLLLTELFLGSHSYNFSTSFYENWIEIEISVNEMIKVVGNNLGINFSNDKILLNGLLNHMKPAIYRIKNDIVLENAISNETRLVYEELFENVQIACKKHFEPYINKEIPDEEVAFLTIHFKIALDRKNNIIRNTKNIILVSGFGYGSSELLSQKLLEKYDVNILDVLPYHKFLEIDNYENIDLIISTLDINPKIGYPFPIIKVNPIFSKKDRKNLEQFGLTESKRKVSLTKLVSAISSENNIDNEVKLAETLKKFFGSKLLDDREKLHKKSLSTLLSPKNIKLNIEVENWEEAVRFAGQVLIDNNSVKEDYIDEMIKSVNNNGSYMIVADKIALPHARNTSSILKTDMSLIKLKTPVIFPENKKIQILFPFSSVDQNEHIEALSQLITLIEDYDLIDIIENTNSAGKLKEYIEQNEEI